MSFRETRAKKCVGMQIITHKKLPKDTGKKKGKFFREIHPRKQNPTGKQSVKDTRGRFFSRRGRSAASVIQFCRWIVSPLLLFVRCGEVDQTASCCENTRVSLSRNLAPRCIPDSFAKSFWLLSCFFLRRETKLEQHRVVSSAVCLK